MSKERIKTLEEPGATEVHAVYKHKHRKTACSDGARSDGARSVTMNHFAKQCRTKGAKVHAVEEDNGSDDSYYEELMTMELVPEIIHTLEKSYDKNIHAKMLVEGNQVLLQIDSGADRPQAT